MAAGAPQPLRPLPVAAALAIAALAMAAASVLAVARLAHTGWDPTSLLQVGDQAASRSFVERDFPHPVLVPGYGHDGQQFYVMARTFPHLQEADGHVDRLTYRARRILLPLLVAAAPAGAATVWAILAVNLLAAGAAALALARLATRLGLPAALGAVTGASPALIVSARASLADAPAFALALWGVVVWRRKPAAAAILFTLAALAREHTLVAPAACLLVAARSPQGERRGRTIALLAAPFAAYLGWSAAVSAWLHPVVSGSTTSPLADALRLFDWPFATWNAIPSGNVLLGGVLLLISLAAAAGLRPTLPEVALWLVAEAVLVAISGLDVTVDLLNYARVAPLAVPAFVLATGMRSTRKAVAPMS